jgi:hypothetical protein
MQIGLYDNNIQALFMPNKKHVRNIYEKKTGDDFRGHRISINP